MRLLRRFLQTICCILIVMLVYELFSTSEEEHASRVKLKGDKRERFMSLQEQNQLIHFLSPWKQRYNSRKRSPGIVEVQSQETGFRNVRPPLYMQGQPQQGELAAAVKGKKNSGKDDGIRTNPKTKKKKKKKKKGNHRHKKIRKVRSVLLEGGSGQHSARKTALSQHSTDIVDINRLRRTSEFYVLQLTTGSGQENAEEWDLYGNRKVVNNRTDNRRRPENKGINRHIYASVKQTTETRATPSPENDNVEHITERLPKQTPVVAEKALDKSYPAFASPITGTYYRYHSKSTVSDSRQHTIAKRRVADEIKPLPQSLPASLRLAVVNDLLVTSHFSESHPRGGRVELSCGDKVMGLFRKEFPKLSTQWTLNGEPLVRKGSRRVFRGDVLLVKDLTPNDTGVYECRAVYGSSGSNSNSNSRRRWVTVAVSALLVTSPQPTLLSRETDPVLLDAHSAALARVLRVTDLTLATDPVFGCKPPCPTANATDRVTRQWFFNGTPSVLFPQEIPASLPSPERIRRARPDMAGVWWCQVAHNTSARRWNTSWYRVAIEDPPPSLERWWRSVLRYPWLVSLLGLMLLFSCIGLSILLARCTQGKSENLEIRWQKTKARLRKRESQLPIDASVSLSSRRTSACQVVR